MSATALASGTAAIVCLVFASGQASARNAFDPLVSGYPTRYFGVDAGVAENSGSSTLRVSIELPPGTAGFKPNLSLVYSSASRDGAFGLGWSLPLSEIRCTARFGVPNYAPCPQYELNGQLLVGPDASGSYHTIVETFQRIRKVTGPAGEDQGWEVTQVDGTILRLGVDASSRVEAITGTARWLLSRMEDVHGNEIVINHADLEDEGIAYPTLISYAWEAREIRFTYEDRGDPVKSFGAGIDTQMTQRVREIQVLSNGEVFRRYVLQYSAAGTYTTHRSRLEAIHQFGTDCPLGLDPFQQPAGGPCKPFPPHTFEYSDPRDELGTTGDQWPTSSDSDWTPPIQFVEENDWDMGVRFGDVNGDGRVDMVRAHCPLYSDSCDEDTIHGVYLSTPDGWHYDEPWSNALSSLLVDAPIATPQFYAGSNDTWVCNVAHSTVARPVVFDLWRDDTVPVPGNPPGAIEPMLRWQLQDLNADGRADLLYSVRLGDTWRYYDCAGNPHDPENQDPTWFPGVVTRRVLLNNGSDWVRETALEENLPPIETISFPWAVDGSPNCDDDGLLNTQTSACFGFIHFQPQFVELNGDGRLDLVVLEPQSPGAIVLDDIEGYGDMSWPYLSEVIHLAVGTGVSATWLQASDGSGWKRSANLPFQHATTYHVQGVSDPAAINEIRELDAGVRFADLNTDGLTDVIWTDPMLASTQYYTPHAHSPTDARGVLMNTGVWCVSPSANPCVPSTGTSWCSSDNDGPCAEELVRYAPPMDFATAYFDGSWDRINFPNNLTFVDANGDGRVDIAQVSVSTPDPDVRAWLNDPGASPGSSVFALSGQFEVFNAQVGSAREVRLIDVDSDGAVDIVRGGDASNEKRAHMSKSRLPDLLTRHHNGMGATTTFAYGWPAGQQDPALESAAEAHADIPALGETDSDANTGISVWPRVAVVVSKTLEAPNLLSPATTDYRYARPRWSPSWRSGLGFRLVETTQPDSSKLTTLFYQAHGRAGRLSRRTMTTSGGAPIRYEEAIWGLVDPTSVGDPATSMAGAHVGRLVSRLSRSEYGATVGATTGAVSSTIVAYDDDYGYNFVSQIDSLRPTGFLRTIRIPEAADKARWLVGLVDEIRKHGSAAQPPDQYLERTTYEYVDGKVSSITEHRKVRGAAGAALAHTTSLVYDDVGNLVSITDPKLRRTEFCYDGDVGWCPSLPGESHSLLRGIKDALGGITSIYDNPTLGQPAVITSTYTDQPTVRREFDPFGRIAFEYVTPKGGSELAAKEVEYDDVHVPPVIKTTHYVDGTTSGDTVREAVVGNGLGGIWKTITETPSGWIGTAVAMDPSAGVTRETYPIVCADDLCTGLTGLESPSVVATRDALGRVVRLDPPAAPDDDTAEGFALVQFGAGQIPAGAPPGLSTSDAFDVVLEKNAKGDLTRRILDGERVVLVQECENSVDPTSTSLASTSCENPDETFYTHEALGEISTIYDALAVDSASYNDPAHFLRYTYDTLGRIVEIRDPDGGTITTHHDEVGNIDTTTNGRFQSTNFSYDALDRLVGIVPPAAHGESIDITYRALELQRESVSGDGWTQSYLYDDLGRLERKTYGEQGSGGVGAFTLLMDFRYDLLGRTTQLIYPDDETILNYEYEGAYLERVCEVDDPDENCSDTTALPYVSDVVYDPLGRRLSTETPTGVRNYEYSSTTHRLIEDEFVAASPSTYSIRRDYGTDHVGYDPLGNLIEVKGSASEPGDPVVEASYTYDQRNRLSAWMRPLSGGTTEYFRYDRLGNMVSYATPSPTITNQVFDGTTGGPHAVTWSGASGALIGNTYDGDGNLASTGGGGSSRYYTFDWANRLTKVGSSAGSSSVISVSYDADGSRIADFRPGKGERIYLGDHVTLHRDSVQSSTFETAEFHIFAFGETIAYKRQINIALRTAWGPGAWLGFRLPPALAPFAAGLLMLTSGGGLLLLVVRLRLHVPIARHPALATGAWTLVLLVAIPPLPMRAGGGGDGVMRRWLVTDHLGSGTVWLDEAGLRVRHTEYAPFGKVDAEVAAGDTLSPWLYAGHRKELSTGLHYMQARWYSPETGTFASVDPVVANAADPQAYNAYAYVGQNPINMTDPTGMAGCGDRIFCGSPSPGGSLRPDPHAWPAWAGIPYGGDPIGMLYPLAPAESPAPPPPDAAALSGFQGVRYASASPDAGIETITVYGEPQQAGIGAAIWLIGRALLAAGQFILRAGRFVGAAIGASAILAYNQIALRFGLALRAPPTFDTKFGNIVGNLFKAGDTIAGGTAGAIRHTATTGQLVGGSNHIQAGIERARALDRVLRRGVNALDAANARALRADLVNALSQAGVKAP